MLLSVWNVVWIKSAKKTQYREIPFSGCWAFLCLDFPPSILGLSMCCQARLLLSEDTKWFQRSGSIPHCSKTFMMSIWVASTGLPFGLRSPLLGCFIFIPLTSLIFILSLHSKTSLIILEKVPQCCRLMAIAFFV
ncbi:hypothetical protein PATA110615_13790 [Paenibacillus taichungensis]